MAADLTSGLRPGLRRVPAQSSTHAGLWLDRYLDLQTWEAGREPLPGHKEKARSARDHLIEAVVECPVPEGYPEALQLWRGSLEEQRDRVALAEAKSLGRVIVGLGAKGAGEFGITLHHTWGVPILPGSSLKGIAALGADRYLEDEGWRRREDAAQAREGGPNAFDALFGDVEEQGAVIFHDAWLVPENKKNGLFRDVLTVHHPDYYQKDGRPSDTDSPIPVPFVSAKGTFLIALELHPNLDPEADGRWLRAAWEALRLGLARHGVGSKTNSSYGRLELPEWSAVRAPPKLAPQTSLPPKATSSPRSDSPKPQPPRRSSLSEAEIRAVLDQNTGKRGLDHNAAARAFAAMSLDADTLDRAATTLERAGAKPGHLKELKLLRSRLQ